jgi:hypothetical protein
LRGLPAMPTYFVLNGVQNGNEVEVDMVELPSVPH